MSEPTDNVGTTTRPTLDIATLMANIAGFAIDRHSIPQYKLDLDNRSRTSLFPWRGQFSPELIEFLLTEYADSQSVVLDPFVGSGTVLFEAARKSLSCFGVEINPAAVEMARTAHFVNIEFTQRNEHLRRAQSIVDKHISSYFNYPLFAALELGEKGNRSLKGEFQDMVYEASSSPFVHNIVANTIIRYMGLHGQKGPDVFWRAFNKHKAIVQELPYSPNPCKVFHRDARDTPLDGESVDLIITSPPYINVFNYHQQYRKAMELLGWDLLRVAKSEFGSNRKNRGNRFLTVVQYAVDMLQALGEMRRLIAPGGRIVIIIGRESNVRGVSFKNGQILAALAVGGAGLHLTLKQERKFLNRYGETIYEDILHFVPRAELQPIHDRFARSIARHALSERLQHATNDVRNDILMAMEKSGSIGASPLFQHQSEIGEELA
jgi:DNA modification methylase